MEIRQFEDKDIKDAGRLAYEYWSGELPDSGTEIKEVIYEYMVRHYDRNRELSFSVTADGELRGFLLAFQQSDDNQSMEWLLSELERFSPEEQKLALEYHAYYAYNGEKTKEYLVGNEAIVGLYFSTQKGCGGMLLNQLLYICKQRGIPSIYLWTDMSCNYNYYYRNNFEEVVHLN